jgi:hypothetical protein
MSGAAGHLGGSSMSGAVGHTAPPIPGLPYVRRDNTHCPTGQYGFLFFSSRPMGRVDEGRAVPFFIVARCCVRAVGECAAPLPPIAVASRIAQRVVFRIAPIAAVKTLKPFKLALMLSARYARIGIR